MAVKKTSYFVNQLIQDLTIEGEKAMIEAYNKRDFTNRTYNLYDSYGSAVYLNGRLLKYTIRYLGSEKGKPINALKKTGNDWIWDKPRSMPDWRGERRLTGDEIDMRGRDEIMEFFQKYKPNNKGIELVVVAAMFYASYLEKGLGKAKTKYKVISGGFAAMQRIQSKYEGSTLRRISTERDLTQPPTIKDKSWK